MARIGSKPIPFGDDVNIDVDAKNYVTIKGPKGELSQQLDPDMAVNVEEDAIVVNRPTDQKRHRSMHGLTRSLLANMIEGVEDGYSKSLTIIGVGYRASVNNGTLELALGYSHPIFFLPPEEIEISVDSKSKNDVITVEGIDKQLVGQVAAKIRSLRPPEPYNGKGVRYVGEHVPLKAGKTAAR